MPICYHGFLNLPSIDFLGKHLFVVVVNNTILQDYTGVSLLIPENRCRAGVYGDQQKHSKQGTIAGGGGTPKGAMGGSRPCGGGGVHAQFPCHRGRKPLGVLREQRYSWLILGEAGPA